MIENIRKIATTKVLNIRTDSVTCNHYVSYFSGASIVFIEAVKINVTPQNKRLVRLSRIMKLLHPEYTPYNIFIVANREIECSPKRLQYSEL